MRYILISLSVLLISCSPLRMYETQPEVLAWENDILNFEELDKTETYSENAILFAGSSSIRLWSTLASDMAPYPVIQRGYGGSRLSDFAVYASRIFDPHPCKAIVLFIANDIPGNETDKNPEEVLRLYKNVLKTIRKKHPSTPVFWIAITPSASRWKVWPQIKKVNTLIEESCSAEKNTYFITTEYAFLGDNGEPIDEYFRSDRLHLTEKGYAVWTEIIKSEIKKVVPIPNVEIIGHRGSSYLAPENTVASAKLAWEEGADAVECDIYFSKDNKIIACHDANTKRTTGKSLVIKDTEAAQLRDLDAGSFKDVKYKGEKLPFLDELIQTIPDGKELVIEIKCGPEVLPELKKTIAKYGNEKKFVFIAFDFETIKETKKVFPEKACYWLCSNKELLEKTIDLVPEAGLDGISLSYSIIDEEIANKTRQLNLGLFTWTVDNPEEANRLISLGVKGITTNRPGWLREQVYQ